MSGVGGTVCVGMGCVGNGWVAAANDENVEEVCGVGGAVIVAGSEAWRFEGCPNRWSVGGDVGPCTGGVWSENVDGSEGRT